MTTMLEHPELGAPQSNISLGSVPMNSTDATFKPGSSLTDEFAQLVKALADSVKSRAIQPRPIQSGRVQAARLHPIYFDKSSPLERTFARLDRLYGLIQGWDRPDMDAPNPASIDKSRAWITNMYRDAQNAKCSWSYPHVSTNEDGDVTFEWWNCSKKLTVYVAPNETWYIKSWGADIHSEMTDGNAESIEERQDIWSWLMDC